MANSHRTSYGGEAVFDGVMMRGNSAWSLAVRTPSGAVEVEVHRLSPWMTAGKGIPILRGVVALAASVVLGCNSLVASLRYRTPGEPARTTTFQSVSVGVGVTLVLAMFLGVPVLIAATVDGISASSWLRSVLEAVVRLGLVFGYIAVLGLVGEVREVFKYHGAEHQAIAGREAGVVLEPGELAGFPRAHPRCGTSFLLLIVAVGIVIHGLVGVHPPAVMALSRVVLLPLVVGCTYELIRFASMRMGSRLGRWIVAPGIALQHLTTRTPDSAHMEVAIAALEAVVAADAQNALAAIPAVA